MGKQTIEEKLKELSKEAAKKIIDSYEDYYGEYGEDENEFVRDVNEDIIIATKEDYIDIKVKPFIESTDAYKKLKATEDDTLEEVQEDYMDNLLEDIYWDLWYDDDIKDDCASIIYRHFEQQGYDIYLGESCSFYPSNKKGFKNLNSDQVAFIRATNYKEKEEE